MYKNERPVGFVTDRDIVVSCVAEGHPVDDPISHAMNREIISVHEKDDITFAAKLMKDKQVSRLLVVDEGERPVGMLSMQNLSEIPNDELTSNVLYDINR